METFNIFYVAVGGCDWVWVGVTGCGWLWLGVTGCGWVGKMVKPNNNRMKNVIKYVKSVKFLNVKLLNQLIVMEH